MPFYGRPSKGCSSCRERRIKCDRLEPLCSQCKRAGKACGGYRDVPSFMFRNENEKAARRSAEAKARSEARRRLEDGIALDSDISTPGSRAERSPSEALVCRGRGQLSRSPRILTLSTPLEDQGLQFFINQFVTPMAVRRDGTMHVSSVQPSSYFGPITLDRSSRDAVVSVGLAAMSNVNRDRELRILSREKHVLAIKAVQEAVGDPAQANPDRMFHLIVMLSLYEMVSCAPNQLDSWAVHLDGAGALLKQATVLKFLATLNHRAQLQFYFVFIVKYFSNTSTPPDSLNWSPDVMGSVPLELLPAVNLVDILIRFMHFDASLRQQSSNSRSIIDSALMFEDELRKWEASLPESWTFSVQESDTYQGTFYGKYHVYKDPWVSRIFNHYRWARLLANEIVLSTISSLRRPTPEELIQRQNSLETISCMALKICMGVASHEAISQRGLATDDPSHVPPLNGIFMMLFPLAVAGGAAGIPDHVHDWVIGTLEQIGRSMGIQRAIGMIARVKKSHGKWKEDQARWQEMHTFQKVSS